MEELIPIVNRLQDAFASINMDSLVQIDLPQIAVVGSQSSGKSSVLETIVGRDFLPRGSGIVTRRPLVLQLNKTPSKQQQTGDDSTGPEEEWGEFLHVPNKKFYDFTEIRNEIIRETDRVTGSSKGISDLPINLKIYSPNVLNLTLVDLPGITKVPVGDQPKDIEAQIRNMIMKFISKPNCLILAVTAANTDIANSDALKLAKEVDKNGSRTIGVLTKIDIMDQGTDCMDVLRGELLPLRLGYIGVVCRSQNDINLNKSIRDALRDEERFFATHPIYKSISDRMGTKYLAKTLNRILLNHIKEVLPEVKSKVAALIQQAQTRLQEYGVPLGESSMSNGALLLQLLTDFSTDFVETIDGRNAEVSTNELFGGARINHIFTNKFYPSLSEIDACENLSDYDIRTAIRNAKGPRTSLFIPEAAFEMLVKRQVKLLEDPSIQCVDRVLEELIAIEEHCEKIFLRFPNLKEKAREFVIGLLKEYADPLKEFIRNIIKIELAYINTNHPDFFSNNKVAGVLGEAQKPSPPMQGQPQLNMSQPQSNLPQQQVSRRMPPPINQPPQQHQMSQQQDEQYNDENADNEWEQVSTYPPPKNPSQVHVKHSLRGQGSSSNKEHKDGGVAKSIFSFFTGHKDGKDEKKSNDSSFFDNVTGSVTVNTNRDVEVNVSLPKNVPKTRTQKQQPTQQPPPPTRYSPPNQTYSQSNPHNENVDYYGQENFEDPYSGMPQQNPTAAFLTNFEEREKKETETIKTLLQHYFDIVRKGVSDSVPKSVMHFLVNKSKVNLQSELVRNLYKPELFDELLKENEAIAQKRKAASKLLSALLKAQDTLNEIKTKKI
ncbi:hypothetical protein FDP41_000539 [Naegleria fowleri]|uniref:Dynamin GTPase n=1 Tax=Naegleria fowleri TaxID=5763 RepID=A0A6A5CGG2_NAEFO|nr:uncharacterized protein FDP41_000539 [Naegleria fowleri]KAF0984640.1 hypothetical protein FDP41_000539 [Naegleria fowleri]